jgi:hypothetical protein
MSIIALLGLTCAGLALIAGLVVFVVWQERKLDLGHEASIDDLGIRRAQKRRAA